MRLSKTIMFASAALISAPVFAQAASTAPATNTAATAPSTAASPAAGAVTKGATVYDASGGVVGSVESVEAGFATVSTGKNKARLPLESFAAGEKGPLLGMTRDQLDAAASAAAGSAASADNAATPEAGTAAK